MRLKDLLEGDLMEGKIPEYIMSKIELAFSGNRGKFASASEKFIRVRDVLANRQPDKETKELIKNVTPAMFFQYKQGKRYMIEPDPKKEIKTPPKVSKDQSKDIPFTVDTTGEFKPLPSDIKDKHTIPEIVKYYKNTYYNSIPTKELANKIIFYHLSYDDKINTDDVVKMIEDAPLDASIKKRLTDDQIIQKSKEHFGFKNDAEIQQAIDTDYKDMVREINFELIRSNTNSVLPYGDKDYDKEKRYNQNFGIRKQKVQIALVNAYLKRDAKELARLTKELQIMEYIKVK